MKWSAMRTILFAMWIVLFAACAHAATVVYVGSAGADAASLPAVRAAAQFYGLDLVTMRPETDKASILKRIHAPGTIALVIDASALPALDRKQLLARTADGRQIAVLIAGIREGNESATLQGWSEGAVTGVAAFQAGSEAASYAFANVPAITRQLSKTSLRTPMRGGAYLTVSGSAEVIMRAKAGGKEFPVFVRTHVGAGDVFFAAQGSRLVVPSTPDPYRQQAVFASMAPAMLFLRNAAGDQAWHTPGNYANLTVDDVWLREPYGNLNYEDLLHEMEVHRFHTTMAFIPWNYDRSQPKMIALFKEHPDLLSICIHGNNHVHQEFGPLATHPLSKQTADMRQAVARMERFESLTGIPYDRVMVFPHSIAPSATFAELKRANYLATANSLNVPSDADPTSAIDVALRTTTLQYANFPSMRRYSAETDIPTAQFAIDSFLGNPILLYVHEGFFADGMNRFDATADTINRLDPAVQWRGLGYVANHSYLERTVSERRTDIELFTATAEIHNQADHPIVYSIQKAEDFSSPASVLIDGKPAAFQRAANELRLEVAIDGGQRRQVTIQYGEPLNLAAIDISKSSLSAAMIRHLSDFRDDVVSKSALGRAFIHSYADNGSLWNRAVAAGFVLLLIIFLVLRSLRRSRSEAPLTTPLAGRR